jgi:predicted DNA-binding ribbon-helix-helix protein
MSEMRKHSVTLAGHRTSYSIEPQFQAWLVKIARERSMSLAALIEAVDGARSTDTNLSSALRLAVLDHLQSKPGVTD